MELRRVRRARHRVIVRGDRGGVFAGDLQHHAEIGPAGGRPGVERHGAAELRGGRRDVPGLGQRLPGEMQRRRGAGGITERCQRAGRIAVAQKPGRERPPQPAVLRRQGQRGAILRRRLRGQAQPVEQPGEVVAGMRAVGPGARDGVQQIRGRRRLPHRAAGEAEQQARFRVRRVGGEQRVAMRHGRGEAAGIKCGEGVGEQAGAGLGHGRAG